jgi:hypothetical protein
MTAPDTFRRLADLNGLPSREQFLAAGFSLYQIKAIERAPQNYEPEITQTRAVSHYNAKKGN